MDEPAACLIRTGGLLLFCFCGSDSNDGFAFHQHGGHRSEHHPLAPERGLDGAGLAEHLRLLHAPGDLQMAARNGLAHVGQLDRVGIGVRHDDGRHHRPEQPAASCFLMLFSPLHGLIRFLRLNGQDIALSRR